MIARIMTYGYTEDLSNPFGGFRPCQSGAFFMSAKSRLYPSLVGVETGYITPARENPDAVPNGRECARPPASKAASLNHLEAYHG